MKTILLRFESEIIHVLECTIQSWELTLVHKEKIDISEYKSQWEKYYYVMEVFSDIHKKHSPDLFCYSNPWKFRGIRKDEEGIILSWFLEFFGFQNKVEVTELTKQVVKQKLNIKDPEFKALKESRKTELVKQFWIAKTDKIIDCLLYVYMVRECI